MSTRHNHVQFIETTQPVDFTIYFKSRMDAIFSVSLIRKCLNFKTKNERKLDIRAAASIFSPEYL